MDNNQSLPPTVTGIDVKSIETMPEYYADSSEVKVSAKKLDEIGEKCKMRLDQLKQLRSDSKYEEERQRDFDSYHLVAPKKSLPYAGYPNLACPLPRIAADTMHANTMFTFGGQEGRFKVLPDFLSRSHMDVAKRAADYMTYVLNYESGLYQALDRADMDCNKYENGYLKARYCREYVWETRTVTTEQIVPEIDELTGEVKRKTVKKKKKERIKKCVFDGTKVERIAPTSVLVSPVYTTVKEAIENDYLFEVGNYNMRFLNEKAIAPEGETPFFSPAKVKQVKDYHRSEIISRMERNKQSYDGYQIDRELELTPLELAEAHFREDINDDGLAEKVSVIFETSSGTVLRISFAECRIVKLSPRPIDGRWDSESIRKAIAPLVLEWEAIHNQRVAKGQWSNLPFGFYKAGGRFNPQMITLMPGKLYPIDDTTNVNFPQIAGPDASYFNEEKLIMELVDRVLALGDVIQGVSGGKDTSATSTIQSVQRAGIRLATPINRIAGALEELIGHIWELNKQCAPEVKEFKVAGIGDGTPVFHKMTSRDYDTLVSFKLHMATMYDVQMVRDTALLNYKTFISNPLFMQNPAAFYQLTQNTMDAVGLKIKLAVPEQAKAKSPFEEHDLILQGEDLEPVIGEDVDEHLKGHMALMRSEEFETWPEDRKMALMQHYDKTQILKQTLNSANLNQSGMFEGMNGPMMGPQAGMTASRNPSQSFNNLRVEETGASQRQNVNNAMSGGDNASASY